MERLRIHPEFAIYYLTYSVIDWLPAFVSEPACKILTDSLCYCHEKKHLRINAYVVMPTHIHLIAFDADADSQRLIGTLADFRKFTGRQLADYFIDHGPHCYLKTLREEAIADRERRFWQPSRHPEAIFSQAFWQQKLTYLHDNPCRKGLVRQPDHWRFSSARWYASDGNEAADIPLTAIE